jgi:antitoxin ParD1/3/4
MNISVSLTPELLDMVKARVGSGRYTSTSEVIRDALRLMERTEDLGQTMDGALREAWIQGLESGDGGLVDFAELKAEGRKQLAKQARN